MKNKYKGLAEYLVKKDQYLALNLEQARYIVKLVKAFDKKRIQDILKKSDKVITKLNDSADFDKSIMDMVNKLKNNSIIDGRD
jgi:hypothetical protein